jgi:hypothetical protein
MELLVIIVFIYAVHSAVEDTKSALRKSRDAYGATAAARFPKSPKSSRVIRAARHDAGFWAGQAAHLFPAARHGLAAGWHAGRQAQDEGRAARAAAKADHLETRVRLIPEVRAHVARQRAALEQLRAEREAQEGTREGSPQSVMAPPRRPAPAGDAPGEVAICPEGSREGTRGGGPADPDGPRDTWAPGAAGTSPRRRVCVACGNPEYGPRRGGGNWGPLVTYTEPLFPDRPPEPRLVHQAHFEDESTGFYGRPYEDAPAQDGTSGQPQEETEGSGEGTAAPETEPPAPPTQGEPTVPVAADTTYDGVLTLMTQARADAETNAAVQQQLSRNAEVMSDQMQALEVDPRTLSAMADHLDAQQAAVKAQERVQETAETVEAQLKRGHQGLKEAHDNAPVTAAARGFYVS